MREKVKEGDRHRCPVCERHGDIGRYRPRDNERESETKHKRKQWRKKTHTDSEEA